MRGRKCHGKRKAIYRKFRTRSLKRAKRANKIHAKNKWQGDHVHYHINGNWPWSFVGTGAKQKQRKCKRDAPNHHDGPHPLPPPPYVKVESKGRNQGVRIHRVPPPVHIPPHDTHDQDVGSVYRFIPLKHRGHKVGRMNGAQRMAWGAYRWWRGTGGPFGGMWPRWDPQHRTPIDPSS